ncbi:MAG: response regulator [Candidatus Latescibacteria bacterium]|nr:response regulator [Candidatus Latescibacterota bacterium]
MARDPKLILHIEDNPSNRKVVRHILRQTQYHLLEAEDGGKGLEMAAREKPNLILLDLQLPVLPGREVARRLKADSQLRHIPIIVLTSYALRGDREEALEAGADEYLAKPYRPQQLLEQLDKYLSAQVGHG